MLNNDPVMANHEQNILYLPTTLTIRININDNVLMMAYSIKYRPLADSSGEKNIFLNLVQL